MKNKRRIVIDFEVLSNAGFWLCAMKDFDTKQEHLIINDREELIRVYNKNKDAIWVGYNIKFYDQWIFKSILAGIDPCPVSEKIVKHNVPGWKINRSLNYIRLKIFELGSQLRSLKELELFMGEDIRESSVPFEIDRYPTEEEIEELASYCMHDVRMTYKVFENLYYEYEAQEGLIQYFNLDDSLFNKTKAQLSAVILQAKKPDMPRNDMYDFKLVDTLKLDKYKNIKEWYLDPSNRDSGDGKSKKYLKAEVYGVESDFGWGGFHGARKKYEGEKYIVNSDVSSFYPAMMIEYNLLSRNVKNPEKFREIRDTRIKMKRDKDPQEGALKIVLNSTFGASKDVNNELYDPMQGLAICVNGQLLLLDLIEKVEMEFGDNAIFIQGNTDGVMFKFTSKEDVDRYLEIANEWSARTRMDLEHDFIDKIIQKDVNNYIYVEELGEDGDTNKRKIKSKGSYVKKLSVLDNDLPIVNKALVNKLIYDIDIEDTINNSNDLIDFQKCVKISNKYKCAVQGEEVIKLKVLRVFASKNPSDYPIKKLKIGKDVPDKIGNTPDRAFMDNGYIIGKSVPENLDKEWYIQMANKRLKEFRPEDGQVDLFDIF